MEQFMKAIKILKIIPIVLVFFGGAKNMSESGIIIGVKYFMANKNATHSHSHSDSDAVFWIWIRVSYCYCLTARQILHIFVWPAFYCAWYMSILLLMSHIVTVLCWSVCIWMPTVPLTHTHTDLEDPNTITQIAGARRTMGLYCNLSL